MEISERTAWFSVLTNLTLVAIKSALAFLSGSLAIRADAIHSLSDVVSSGIILVGIKISLRPARGFPYGLYKVENLVSLVTALFILYAGYEICVEVFTGAPPPPSLISIAAVGIGFTLLITWLFSRYELRVGKETGSPSLVADAQHIRSDMLSSIVILVSLLGSATGMHLDRYAALIVVAFIARTALSLLLDSVRVLLDASLDNESLNRIREIVLADPRVGKIRELRGRNAGRYKFVELDLSLHVKELEKGHRITEEIAKNVKHEISNVDRVLIHYQPAPRKQLTLGIPLNEDQVTVSDHFGEAPFFRLLSFTLKNGELIAEHVLRNPYQQEEKAKGIKVAKWLLKQGLDVLIVRHDQAGKGPSYVLDNAGAEVLVTQETDAKKALADIGDKFRSAIT